MKYALIVSLIVQSSLSLAELLPVFFTAPSPAHYNELVRNDTYDFGCRPVAQPVGDGTFKLHALLTKDQISYLTNEYKDVPEIKVHRQLVKRVATAPIGTGDR
ncbi:hypothetical protein C1H76_5402 [Elsinoe australis]|uniref:Uncharacterized protein n=1 Tax=Elsinoe australis TaxID=40998 RepID=A0A4U7AWM6_9PEZI|nr:hypothetical protein C1H76_5402 [Elsinoe australis]